MISVIVPAHDEANVIEAGLRALTTGAGPDELDVVVVCNGCTDDTAVRAKALGPPVRVHETTVASKAAALNLGDSVASGFPRFYVDADVVFDLDSLRTVAEVLQSGAPLAATPEVRLDVSRTTWIVRSYYRIWSRLPSIRDGLVGRGVYAVSEAGRARFDRFPDLVADDHFLRSSFRADERTVVDGAWSTVRVPRTARGLVRRKARVHAGNLELAANDTVDEPSVDLGTIARLVADEPARVADAVTFLVITAVVRGVTAWRARSGPAGWARDDSRPSEAGG